MSVSGITAFLAGTKLPICAINNIRAFCLKNVDFHHIFGHVIICTYFFSVSVKSLLIKSFSVCSITGCLAHNT
ncbi:MAG: hypothetical protein Q8S84_00420 [bacterium]|nr:hypothetical protein [bacterium]